MSCGNIPLLMWIVLVIETKVLDSQKQWNIYTVYNSREMYNKYLECIFGF